MLQAVGRGSRRSRWYVLMIKHGWYSWLVHVRLSKVFFLRNHHLSLCAETVRVDFSSFETNVRTRAGTARHGFEGGEQTEPWDLSSIWPLLNVFSPPARWGLLDFITVVLLLRRLLLLILHLLLLLPLPLLQLLLHHLCIHSHVHFRLANSSPTSARSGHCWTSTARVWAHWAPLDLNLGPSELSEHRWTSTWDPPSSVSTADLNLGPSELSEHRWTSRAR